MSDYGDYGAIVPAGAAGYDAPSMPIQDPPDRELSYVSAELYAYHYWAIGAFAVGDYPLFLTPIGNIGQGFPIALTELQTNIRVSGQLPGGVAWRISHVGVDLLDGNNADDNINFLRHTFIDFIRGSSRQTMGLARFFPGGAGSSGYASTTLPVTDLRTVQNGVPSFAAMRELDVPIELPPNEQFSFEMRVRNHVAGAIAVNTVAMVAGLRLVGERTEATQL